MSAQAQEPDPTCAACGGDGWTLETDHAPECYAAGEHVESADCPVQVQEQCRTCGGSGRLDR